MWRDLAGTPTVGSLRHVQFPRRRSRVIPAGTSEKYEPPTLQVYGDIRQITQGSQTKAGFFDSQGNPNANQKTDVAP